MSNPQFFAHDQLNDLVCPIVSHQQEVMHSVHERPPLFLISKKMLDCRIESGYQKGGLL